MTVPIDMSYWLVSVWKLLFMNMLKASSFVLVLFNIFTHKLDEDLEVRELNFYSALKFHCLTWWCLHSSSSLHCKLCRYSLPEAGPSILHMVAQSRLLHWTVPYDDRLQTLEMCSLEMRGVREKWRLSSHIWKMMRLKLCSSGGKNWNNWWKE